MIDHNQSHCDPPDIINVHLSHKNTTFAIIFNIITKVVSSKSALQIYVIPVKKGGRCPTLPAIPTLPPAVLSRRPDKPT